MFEHSPSDRMQLVGVGDLLPPGCCMHCGNGTHKEGYLRLDINIDYFGECYLCTTCLIQAAEVIKCLIPEEADALRTLAEQVAQENILLREQVDEQDKRLALLDQYLEPFRSGLSADSISIPSGTQPDENSGQQPQVTDGASTESATAEPKSSESNKNSGRKRSVRVAASDTPGSIL